jgi:farnesyl diphosphate synthase
MRAALHNYGQELGLAFQIADDILDVEGEAGQMGKAARKDSDRGKSTVVSVLGIDRARAQAEALSQQAVRHLDLFDDKADLLRAAAQFVVQRRA